ncbi:transporter substrate-binding domain-containing protein [Leeia sp. TBRC 13508]|uniref:Transporter substrate-binding domain-containing protein n=1 Tax=Leeia speluncae TaxID=2884804 RepID=A0ABS8DAL6_9NEIS|nr:transporter substrate-binding domain-containing protein [Leeia speluncae]MCB6184653.1 transporter substrate-binding domain-containing protein [Leeia speluncae]
MKLLFKLGMLAGVLCSALHAETLKIAIQGALPPYDYMEGGKMKGFNVDITNALCMEMKVTCQIVKTPWENIIPNVAAGKVDAAISTVTITEERKKIVAFTDKYAQTPGSFVAKKGKFLSVYITNLDLQNKVIGYQAGTTYANLIKGRYPQIKSIGYPSTDKMYEALVAGEIDIAINDMVSSYDGFLQSPAGKGYELVGSPIRDSKYMGTGEGIVVRLGNQALVGRFNKAIATIRQNRVYDQIMNKYFIFNIY